MPSLDEDDLRRRAMGAYFRAGGTAQPADGGEFRQHDGTGYVVLRNCNGVLAVYQVKKDGGLQGLKDWPDELNVEQ